MYLGRVCLGFHLALTGAWLAGLVNLTCWRVRDRPHFGLPRTWHTHNRHLDDKLKGRRELEVSPRWRMTVRMG